MMTYTQKNIAVVFLIALSITMYDLLIDLMDQSMGIVMDLFEWFEFGLESLIQSSLDLSYHQTQIVTFYCMVALSMLLLVILWIKIPIVYRRIRRNLKANWLRQKKRTSFYWRSLSLFNKTKYVTFSVLGASSIVMLI